MLSYRRFGTICAMLLIMTGHSFANPYDDTTFNIGGDISVLNWTSYNNGNSSDINNFKESSSSNKLAIRKNAPGVNIYLGIRMNEYVGMQVGFSFIDQVSGNTQNGLRATNKVSNIYLDLLGFLNIAAKVDMTGLVGVGGLKSKSNVNGATFINLNALNKQKAGVRFGGGLQYNFAESWASRAMLIYQKGNPEFLKSLISVSLGIIYTFSV